MPLSVLALVLVCAVLHAGWNAWVKASRQTTLALGTISLGWCAISAVGLFFVPWPSRASYGYVLVSVFVHQVYVWGLARLYEGDSLSRVYVLMRAVPPVLVTVVSGLVLSERVSLGKGLGIALVLAGVFVVSPPKAGFWRAKSHSALAITILSIASYTLVDGIGARKSGSPLGYALLLCLGQGAVYAGHVASKDGRAFTIFIKRNAIAGVLAAAASIGAYAGVLYSASRAPLGLVAALRESSVLVASFLGAALLGEKVTRFAWLGAVSVFIGAVCMEEPWSLR